MFGNNKKQFLALLPAFALLFASVPSLDVGTQRENQKMTFYEDDFKPLSEGTVNPYYFEEQCVLNPSMIGKVEDNALQCNDNIFKSIF